MLQIKKKVIDGKVHVCLGGWIPLQRSIDLCIHSMTRNSADDGQGIEHTMFFIHVVEEVRLKIKTCY